MRVRVLLDQAVNKPPADIARDAVGSVDAAVDVKDFHQICLLGCELEAIN
jgi:hypothetical protein